MNGESPVQGAHPAPLPAPRKDALGRSAFERWIDRILPWYKVIVPLAGILVALWFIQDAGGLPAISRTITRHRLAGVWSVSDRPYWRFGSDGALRQEGLTNKEGRYQVLDGDRIRITGIAGAEAVYTYEFDSLGLWLREENGSSVLRLTRRN